jgi:hypothetical protein
MRHYDRVNYRHLNDSERYRDYDYLGDDAWVGPNERVPHGAVDENQAPWSTLDGYETGALLDDHAFERGGRRMPLPREERVVVDERTQQPRPRPQARRHIGAREGLREAREVIRHPGSFLGRVVRGIFHGRGPKNWLRSDTRIHDEVCELLARDSHIDATNIDVVVKDGEVTLNGSVPDRRTKRLAEEVLDDVLGVNDVHNRLTIG